MGIVVSNVFVDGLDQFRHAGEDAVAQALGRDVAEEPLDPVQPNPVSNILIGVIVVWYLYRVVTWRPSSA